MAFRHALERRTASEQLVVNRLLSQRLGTDNASGMRVTPDVAIGMSTVYACVRLLSDSVSSLPLGAFMHAGRERIDYAEVNGTTPNWVVRPNPYMTRLEFWGQVLVSMLLNGNAYILTVRSPYGDVLELHVIHPDDVRIKRAYTGADTTYEVRVQTKSGPQTVMLDKTELLHIPLFLLPGALYGLSPISAAEVTVGGALAADVFAASHFRNSANPGGSIETPNPMTPAQIKELADGWNMDHQGPFQAGKVGILTNGAEFKPITINAQDAQLLETRRFNVEEIARLYRVPIAKLGHPVAGAMSFASVEAQNLSFVVDSLRTLVERLEQAVSPLLPNPEGFVKFNLDALLRGTTKERYDAYAVAMDRGFISLNDIMASEDKPGIGPAGDVYRVVLQNIDAADAVNTGVDLKVKIAMQLVEGGFDPEAALKFAGLESVAHTGVAPVKLQGIAENDDTSVGIYDKNKPQAKPEPKPVEAAPVITPIEQAKALADASARSYELGINDGAALGSTDINVESPVVNIAPAAITVEQPDIKIEQPAITVEQPQINITNELPKSRTVRTVVRDEQNRITQIIDEVEGTD